jgi:hypothetical protein
MGVKLLIRNIKYKILTHFNRFCISSNYSADMREMGAEAMDG